MALSEGKNQKHWKDDAEKWFKTKDGKAFIDRLKEKDKKELFNLLKVNEK